MAEDTGILSVDAVDVGIDSTMPTNKVTWSTGRNVRFTPGFVSKTPGKTHLGTLAVADLPIRESFTCVATDGNVYTIICTDAAVYSANRDFTIITDITPTSAPTGGYYDLWEFCIVAGLPILTNGKDAIWKWPDPTAVLTPLLNAPLAKRITSCMNRLVCGSVYESGAWRFGRVRWSQQGNPEFWTVDKTKKSGYQDLVDYSGKETAVHNIICQLSIGQKLYVFTEKNLHVCDFLQPVKQFIIIDGAIELMSPRSACVHRGSIYAIGKDDIFKYSEGAKTPIGKPIRRELYVSLNYLAIDTIFNFNMFSTDEVWFCVPTSSATLPNTAYIFNVELGCWTICDCDFLSHALQYSKTVAWVNNSGSAVTWENDAEDTIAWLAQFYRANPLDIVGDSKSHMLLMDSGYNAISTALAATAITGTIETGDFAANARPFEKVVEECFPDLRAQTPTNNLMIQVGVRDNLSRTLRWSPAVAFKIGTSDYADLRSYAAQGAFFRLKFYSSELDSPWSLGSFAVTYSNGRRIR